MKYLDLGGAAGLENAPTDGLSQFKRGWSNATRLVYLCGRVLDPQAYGRICERQGTGDMDYFPAYRAGEFHSRRAGTPQSLLSKAIRPTYGWAREEGPAGGLTLAPIPTHSSFALSGTC